MLKELMNVKCMVKVLPIAGAKELFPSQYPG